MVINVIVLAVTLLMAAFLSIWIFFPRMRACMEEPKYRFLEQQRRFPDVYRDRFPGSEELSQQKKCCI